MYKTLAATFCRLGAVALALQASVCAQTVGVFFDGTVEQIKFAAADVGAALATKGFTVEMQPISSLTASYANRKVVVALVSDQAVAALLVTQKGTVPPGLGAQAYGVRTTASPQKSYWALGGDANGAMYGGLQIAEQIKFTGFSGIHDNDEAPAIRRRGIKLNIPFDRESVTYGKSEIDGINHAIFHVWDLSFWTTWLDEMARHRYNVLSLWSNHPFTSMIKLPEYPEVAIQDVTNFDGKKMTLSIDEKIVFWRKVMAHAKSRARPSIRGGAGGALR